jgi:hypothetical protein
VGSFNEQIMMIDILEIENPYVIKANEPYIPSIKLINNSPIPIDTIFVNLSVAGQNSIFKISRDIPYAVQETINVDSTMFSGIMLPDVASQYEVVVSANCNIDNSTNRLSKKEYSIDVFKIPKERVLIEVFASSNVNTHDEIIKHIDTIKEKPIDVIYHFPYSTDQYYNTAAEHRKNRYNHAGNGYIYFNGNLQKNINNINIINDFDSTLVIATTSHTFLKINELSAIMSSENTMKISLKIVNEDTTILNKSPNYRFQENFKLFVAFIKPIDYKRTQITTLYKYITPADGVLLPVNIGQVDTLYYDYPLYNIGEEPEKQNLSILAWVDNNLTKKVYLHEILSLDGFPFEFTNKAYPKESIVNDVLIYPNPIKINQDINLSFTKKSNLSKTKIDIYNIKGQKVYNETTTDMTLNINEKYITKTGIYFMKISWNEDGKQQEKIKKIIIIK